ncbi:MAG: serine/threonine protein kinase, partial [Acidobacteria bacterium]|nr:serine/threonine protein kinase [Acidobacteriota bacterium]
MPAPGSPRYRVERQIGRGSRADVFLAFDRILNRRVALKQFRERPVTPDSLQREFRILSGLGHPRVVRVFDLFFPAAGLPFLTMEYLQGPSLQAQLPRPGQDGGSRGAPPFRPGPLQDTIEVILGIAAGLRHLHSRKLIHGDLKPTNILYRFPGSAPRPDPGELCLADFGLAGAFRRTGRMEFSGTFRYAAPEMVRGQPIDARSDLFSLG